MKLSDLIGGTCSTLPSCQPTNKDVLQVLMFFKEKQPNKPIEEVSYNTTRLLLNHYRSLFHESELHKLFYINRLDVFVNLMLFVTCRHFLVIVKFKFRRLCLD